MGFSLEKKFSRPPKAPPEDLTSLAGQRWDETGPEID